MKTRIHVDQKAIAANRKDGGDRPIFTVLTYKSNTKARRVEIHGPSTLIYSNDKPLSCGARCWIETESEVIVTP